MNCLVIQISSKLPTGFDEAKKSLVFSMKHYRSLFLETGVIAKLHSKVNLRCANCDSFVVPAADVYDQLQDPNPLFDERERDEWSDDFDNLYQTVYALLKDLTEEIDATDDEWQSYFDNGTPKLAPLHLHGEWIDIPEWADNPLRIRYEDVVFKFGKNCKACNKLFRTKRE